MRLRRRSRHYVARAELVLARPDTDPLGELGLKPDPLQAFALALGRVRDDLGEDAAAVIDVMPATARQQRRLRKRLNSAAERDAKKHQPSNGPGIFDEFVGNTQGSHRATSAQTVHQRSDVRNLWTKLGEEQPLFRVQVLIRAESDIKGRAEAHVKALETCFRQFAGKNHWKVAGWRIPGIVFFGADSWWRRSYFDRRFESGLFRPAKRSVVNAAEIGGLLKPPTKYCKAPGVVRAGAAVAAAPRDLPIYKYRPGVLPLGQVMRDDELITVGMDVDEFFFGGLFGRSRFGKALSLDTPIPTPAGWSTMGELREGAQVFDETGAPCTITAATEVMHDRVCFEVVFSDGSTIVADAEHRWLTWDHYARKSDTERSLANGAELRSRTAASGYKNVVRRGERYRALVRVDGAIHYLGTHDAPEHAAAIAAEFRRCHHAPLRGGPRVVTTREIRETLKAHTGGANHAIQTCEPLQFPARELPLDPYVLGVWLGDRRHDRGGLDGNTRNQGITCAEPELIEQLRDRGVEVRKWAETNAWGIIGLTPQLRAIGVLGDKHIPGDYLRAAPEQRIALLQGLMDTDGWVGDRAGNCEFCVTNRRLADDVYELLCGLGIKVVWTTSRAMLEGRDCGERYRLNFTPTFPVFRLERKLARQRLDDPHPSRCRRYIVDVRPVASVPVRCIAVDSPSRLYLAGRECIPTHNTELALVQFVHAARIEKSGALFFDPHQDAIARVKPYLTDDDVADRVIEINLARRGMDSTHVAWNLLSMEGLGLERVAERAAAVIDSFAVGAGWSGRSAGRTMAILSNAVYSLLYLGLRLPGELQPTIFTLPRFLIDEDWRESTLSYLPEHLQRYWTTTYAGYPGDAAGPLCQLISRLQTNPVVAATFGSPQSTYNPRRAMDDRAIILMCPPSGKEHLVTNLLMQGHIDAARSRADLPPDRRPPAYWWCDEAPAFDQATENAGTSSLAEVLEQCAKYGIRAMPMAQSPHRLSDSTIEALTTNASLLITTATSPKGARFFGDQWEAMDAKRAVQQLERWHYIGQPTHHGMRVEPFRIAGLPMESFWGEFHHPERIPGLEAAIDVSCRPRTVAETLVLIEGHEERILQHIVSGGRPQPLPATAPTSRGGDELAPVSDEVVALDEHVDARERAPVTPAVASEQLLGGVTIKRRRRRDNGAPLPASAPDDGAHDPVREADRAPATLPVPELDPPPEPPPAAIVELDTPAAAVENDEVPAAPRRRLAPLTNTSSGPGHSPLLDSLEDDRERLGRAREKRDD